MIHNFIVMIKKIFTDLDKTALLILKKGLVFCSLIGMVSIFILSIYEFAILSPFMFNIGLTLFRISIIFAIEFIICAVAVDKIKKQLI